MKIILPFLGKTKSQYLSDGIADFSGRLQHFAQLDIPVLKEKKRSAKEDPARHKEEDGQALLAAVPKSAFLVGLDPGGRELSSEELAEMITRWEDQGVREVAFVIGAHLGLAEEVLARANLLMSLSRMTFTHEIARFLLLEQLYRAFSIKAGTGYHK